MDLVDPYATLRTCWKFDAWNAWSFRANEWRKSPSEWNIWRTATRALVIFRAHSCWTFVAPYGPGWWALTTKPCEGEIKHCSFLKQRFTVFFSWVCCVLIELSGMDELSPQPRSTLLQAEQSGYCLKSSWNAPWFKPITYSCRSDPRCANGFKNTVNWNLK